MKPQTLYEILAGSIWFFSLPIIGGYLYFGAKEHLGLLAALSMLILSVIPPNKLKLKKYLFIFFCLTIIWFWIKYKSKNKKQ